MWISSNAASSTVLGQLGVEGGDQLSSITALVNLGHLHGAQVLVLGQLGGLEN